MHAVVLRIHIYTCCAPAQWFSSASGGVAHVMSEECREASEECREDVIIDCEACVSKQWRPLEAMDANEVIVKHG